jgi:antitoxin PrlF
MERSRISSKGQIVIPKTLRETLDWREGDDVVFSLENGNLNLQLMPKRNLTEVLSKIEGRQPNTEFTSFEELLDAEKQSAKQRHARGRI